MVCAVNKVDSNISGLSFAEEVCFKQLPVLAIDGFDPTWYGLEPNSYSDFGGNLTTVARSPIDPSRQNKKGTVTDQEATAGLNHDIVNDERLLRLLQGFFFANARQKPTTQPLNAAKVTISGATASTDKYATSATAVAFNKAGYLLRASGFTNAANNGLKVTVSADGTGVVVGDGLVDEGAPPAAAKLEVVGYQFASADAGITKTGNILTLTSAANVLAGLGLNVGEWLFIGGDTLANNRFVNNVGYGRIRSIAAGAIVLEDTTFAGATEVSTGKTIQIFFGTVLRNEKTPSLIVRKSYQFERTLGLGATSTQAEYVIGAVANELKINIPAAEKLNMDIGFVAGDNTYRSGETGDEIKSSLAGATYVAPLGADAFNTTSHVYRLKMSINDPTTSRPTALFGYVTEGNISVTNGVTPNKAIGVLGAFDTSAANFGIGGSFTAYFSTVAAVQAIRNNADVGFNVIVAKSNAGFVYDIPLLGLGGGRINVEKDSPITVPLEPAGAENVNGYTAMYDFFPYLPTVAMPV